MKRMFDYCASVAGLVLLAPLFLVLAVLIKADSPGPVFFRGRRVGREGRLFHIYKFRSMVAGADRRGPGITTAGDARVTRVGRLLRRTKLDELPQLINVVLGDMALVGPRPEDPRYVDHYTPAQRRLLNVRPGITSPASLAFRREEELLEGEDWETAYVSDILPKKLNLELDYLTQRTGGGDLRLVLLTLGALLPGISHKPGTPR